jgi:exodeoxyribonuclease V beta subunit
VADLDPLRLPLAGRRLIEASAGTGKTHAIGSLLIRAVIGHGADAAPLRLDRILVVTFTRAATLELRDRIRGRLRGARDAFRAGGSDDDFLAALVEEVPDTERAATLLDAALGQLDEAAVFTIHGFCQRILRESAFESGAVFEQDFVLDDGEYVRRAVRDVWRRTIYPLDADAAMVVRQELRSPDALLKRVRPHLGREDLDVRGGLAVSLAEALDEARSALADVKRLWRELDVPGALRAADFSTRKDGPLGADPLAAVDAWCATDEHVLSLRGPDGRRVSAAKVLRLYGSASLAGARWRKKKTTEPDLADFHAVLDPALDLLEAIPATFLADALGAVRAAVHAEKRADRMIAPDDVLRQTALALRGDTDGRFAAHVRGRYPLAFIDEFQDTDPLQYEIFDALYPEADDPEADPADPARALVMIGDPKQAIYGFRGADIHAYLQARAALPGDGRVRMGVNWRSTPEMLEAVEALYTRAEDPFASPQIDFVRVRPRPGAVRGRWLRDGAPAPALTLWHLDPEDDGALAGGEARARLARVAAAEVRALLDGDARLGDRALAPRDLTLLVNDRIEAELLRGALAAAGVASVWQSREPVFATAEARDLRLLLAAALEPRDERAVRAALASRTLGLPLDRLHAETLVDDGAWQAHLDRFTGYHELWRGGGVMSFLGAVLADYAVPDRLLREPDGARRLTDLRHLGELLQLRAAELGSMHRLLRWYVRQLEDPQSDDTAQLRLESDGDLVRIATVHGSKGLEYPVVMAPFAVRLRPPAETLFHEADGDGWRAVLDLRPDDDAKARADAERLAEDLRLLYVALTRAEYACFVGVADAASAGRGPSDTHRSALGHLLLGPAPEATGDAALAAALADLAGRSPQVVVERRAAPPAGAATVPAGGAERARRRPFTGRIDRDWTLTSYSALVAHQETRGPLLPGAQDEVHRPAAPGPVPADAGVAARFPRGARPGSCLHALLETWPADPGEVGAHVRGTLARWGFADDPAAPPEGVATWLEGVRATDLGIGTDLAGVDRTLVEMEFVLPLEGLDARRLNAVLADAGYVAEPLAREQVRGMLRGFVDLVLEHDGRYWVADYKSNWLGPVPASYDAEAMGAAIREHRYDLQFLLYAVALRRLLRRRLPGRPLADVFGGVLYLFLRGMDGGGATGVWAHRPEEAVLDAVDACFAGTAVAA